MRAAVVFSEASTRRANAAAASTTNGSFSMASACGTTTELCRPVQLVAINGWSNAARSERLKLRLA